MIEHSDCEAFLATLPDCSADSCVTDPPYELGFMGKAWDKSGIANKVAMWAEVLRVLKPGAYLLAFSGTRTYHRMVCAIEDAGFEIRDQIGWLYGSGFPKSLDVSKALDRAAGEEREVMTSGKPVKRMIPGADQGKKGWAKDSGREYVPTVTAPATAAAKQWHGWGTALKPAWEPIVVARRPFDGTVVENVTEHGCGALNIDGCRVDGGNGRGRWPANIMHDGSDEVIAAFPESESGANPTRRGAPKFRNTYSPMRGQESCIAARGADKGSSARFFFSAKAGGDEREGNLHPTVKPLALMRYLVRLVTRPGGRVLDHFAGSGSTLIAAKQEGMKFYGCDKDAAHVAIIHARLSRELL